MDGAAPHILFAAVEPSADLNGAALISDLKKRLPGMRLSGCGGQAMVASGLKSLFPIDEFSVMGFTDVVRAVPSAFKRARQIAEWCRDEKVEIAVFIDGWTFSRVCAKRIRKLSPATKIVKYSAPQIWASRPERVDFVKKHFDLVLALLPFEPALFECHGIPTRFVGNPNYQSVIDAKPQPDFIDRHQLNGKKLLTLLPGSRRSEVQSLLPVFAQAAVNLCNQTQALTILVPVAPAVEPIVREASQTWRFPHLLIPPSEKFSAFHHADVALTASGTAATELLLCNVPMVVAYKVDALTYFWAKRVMTTDYVTILNIAHDKEIIPELLQSDCTADALTKAVSTLLNSAEARAAQVQYFDQYKKDLQLTGKTPAQKAGEAIAALL